MQTLPQIPCQASGSSPVKFFVWEDVVKPLSRDGETGLLVPPAGSELWEAEYDTAFEAKKRTTRNLGLFPSINSIYEYLRSPASVSRWSSILGAPVDVDPTMHGGGLHVMAPGAVLNCHLDYAEHPLRKGQVRALNLIAFVHPKWESHWGGQLYLADPMGIPQVIIEPRPGRVVAFEVSDLSYHGVAPVSDDADERITVAAYLLRAGTHTRLRAQFLPQRGVLDIPRSALLV